MIPRRQRKPATILRRLAPAALLAAAAAALPPALLAGRGDKVGAASGMQLSIPLGARAVALAGADLSSISGVEAISWNPAGLVRAAHRSEATFSHMEYLAGIGVEHLAGAATLPGGAAIGVSLTALSVGEIPVTTESFPDGTGETVSPTFLTAGAVFSRRMSEEIAVGLGMNVIYERMAEVSASGLAFTAGVQYTRLGGIDGLSVGVVIRNIGPALEYDGEGLRRTAVVPGSDRPPASYQVEAAEAALPSTIEIGLGYARSLGEPFAVRFSSLFRNNNFADDQYRMGGELSYQDRFFLRVGYDHSTEADGNESIFGPSAGAGVSGTLEGFSIRVDYGFRTARYFSGNHVVSMTLGF